MLTKRRIFFWGVVAIVAAVVVPVVLLLGYPADWTGFGETPIPQDPTIAPRKTLWDWLQLLIVPAVLAIGGAWFTRSERKNAQEIARKDRENEQHIADQRRQEDALQAYLDQMGQLMLDKDPSLRESNEGSEIRTLARARTLAAIEGLDPARKGRLLQFLVESDLVQRIKKEGMEPQVKPPIISLVGANLAGALLFGADLGGAELRGANLEGALLVKANVIGADLSRADLGAADLRGASLGGASLFGALLGEADLSWANLGGANLLKADLSGADLSGAGLREAKVTEEQLDKAKSLKGATMPDGTIHG
jgi:hypothetical protein